MKLFMSLMPSEADAWWERLAALNMGAELALAEHSSKQVWADWHKNFAPALARAAQAQGVPLSVHAYYFAADLGALDDTIRAHGVACLEQDIDIAATLCAQRVICHTGYLPESMAWYREWWTDSWCASLEAPLRRAETAGVQLCLENVFEAQPAIMQDILDRFDSPALAACVDVGHAFVRGSQPEDWLHPRVTALHLHDNDGQGDRHWAPGKGNIDFGRFLQALSAMNFDGQATLEVFGDEAALMAGRAHLLVQGWEI